jgi:hypothetical protein
MTKSHDIILTFDFAYFTAHHFDHDAIDFKLIRREDSLVARKRFAAALFAFFASSHILYHLGLPKKRR